MPPRPTRKRSCTARGPGVKPSSATRGTCSWRIATVSPVAMTRRITLAADKAYDTRDFVGALRLLQVTLHVAQNTSNRSSAIDRRTTRHAGYEVSQQKRKRIEEVFGWLKTIGLLRQTRHRGRRRVGWMFVFSLTVYNLVRIRNLAECPA